MIGAWADGTASNGYEWFRAWQHLANSGFAEGKFTGAQGTGGATHVNLGMNAPLAKSGKGGWALLFIANTANNNWFFKPASGHALLMGAETASGINDGPILSPNDALNIDKKIDDGLPAMGNVRTSLNTLQPNCVSSGTATSTAYAASSAMGCNLYFFLGF